MKHLTLQKTSPWTLTPVLTFISTVLSKRGCPEKAVQESHAAQNVLLGK